MYRFLFAWVAAGAACAADTASLNGSWQFRLAATEAEAQRLAAFHQAGFDASGFRPIPVPANWSLHGFEEPMYGRLKNAGEGFYLHKFKAPAEAAGKRVLLHFGGVWASAEVWLNGRPLGRHDSGFTGFAFDVSKALQPENTLAVRVRQITRDYLYDANDDWSLPGIYRDVWLEWMPAAAYIDSVETAVRFDEQYRDAELQVRALVIEARNEGAAYRLRAVLSRNGAEVQNAVAEIAGHASTGRDTFLRMQVASPAQWTGETPNLYLLRVELLRDGRVVHQRGHAVGFREVSTAGGVLRINGRPVKLRGINRHDQHPDVGRATRSEHWLQDIMLMKAANINFVRTAHYPPAEGFIDACDELGMYVLDEVPLGYGGGDAHDPALVSGALLRAHETVARDRNHPSVIVWSVGNEDPYTAIHRAVIRAVKGADPTRPVLMPWHAEEWLPPEIDILAPHYWSAAQYDKLASRSSRPLLTTEHTHAWLENGFGGLADRWRALMRHAAGAGGAIWMWQDQGLRVAGKLTLDSRGSDGIVTADRKPQRDYWETKAVYAPVTVPDRLEIVPGRRSVAVPVRNDFDFTNLEAVPLTWTLFADNRQLAQGEARVSAEPHTAGQFDLPIAAIGDPKPGVAYYAHLAFGNVITRGTELAANVESMPARHYGIRATRRSLNAGPFSYEFDPRTAQLVGVTRDGKRILGGARLTFWRPLTEIEASASARGDKNAPQPPNLDDYTTRVREWVVNGSGIDGSAEHRIDARNSVTARYRFRIRPDAALEVTWHIVPKLQVAWVPEIGFEIAGDGPFQNFRWLGLGPLDAYPNEKAAAIFGMWSGDVTGVKAMRWAEFGAFRVTGAPYVRFNGTAKLRVLSAVEGRPEKNRRPAEPEYRLDVNSGAEFSGAFTLAPL